MARASIPNYGEAKLYSPAWSLSLLGKKQNVRKYFNYFFETVKK